MKIELTAPRNFSEMTEKQTRYLATLMVAGQTEAQIRTKCFVRFAGIRPVAQTEAVYFFVKPRLKGFFSLTHEEVLAFSNTFKWITKSFVGYKPPVRIGAYKSIDRLLRDTTFATYLDAENCYQAFIYTKQQHHLSRLMAILFVSKWRSRERATKHFNKASEVDKLIALHWFMAIKEEFARKFKYLFRTESNDPDEMELPTAPPNMLAIITNQVRMLTEGDITKNKAVMSANTWDALTELNAKCREYEQMKKQANK